MANSNIKEHDENKENHNNNNLDFLNKKVEKPLYTPSVIKLLSNYINKGIANILHNHMFIILYNLLYNLLRLNQKITSKITHILKILTL